MIESPPQIHIEEDINTMMSLLTNPKLQALYQKIDEDYLYWDKVKYLAPKGVKAELLWCAVKLRRHMQLQSVKFGNYVFYYSITPTMQSLLHEFDMNMGGSLSSNGVIHEKDSQLYLVNSIITIYFFKFWIDHDVVNPFFVPKHCAENQNIVHHQSFGS